MRIVLAAPLIFLCASLHAQAIFKCSGRNGVMTYQSESCATGTRTAAIRPFQRVSADPSVLRRSAEIQQEMDQRGQVMHAAGFSDSTSSSGFSQRDQQKQNCAIAKQSRQQAIQAVGLSRNFNFLRSLDDTVNRACSGL